MIDHIRDGIDSLAAHRRGKAQFDETREQKEE
jgi:hypothetical protein